jgi:hypothetical protein
VILLDADMLVLDLRYPADPRFAVNRQVFQQLQADGIVLGITLQALLETVGILSFNTSASRVTHLPQYLIAHYGLTVFPDPKIVVEYAGCQISEIIQQMSSQMALGDAVQAVQIARHASFADCLLTWNAKHFQGKLVVPVQTPADWLQNRAASAP